jgi:translocation and assembly module TamB
MTTPTTTAPRAPSLLRRTANRMLGLVLAGLLSVTIALGGTAWWAGTEGSLAWTLHALSPYGGLYRTARAVGLPVANGGELATAGEVTGSLRHGGQVAALTWQHQGTALALQGVALHWDAEALLRGELHISQLNAQSLRLTLPASSTPSVPPSSLVLPLPVHINFKVQQLQLQLEGEQGGITTEVLGLAGRYVYAGHHALRIDTLSLAQGQYTLQADIQAQSPMQLDATLSGHVNSTVPGGAGLTVLAQATVNGTLAGPQAALNVQAQLRPDPPQATGPTLEATARVLPWSPQPLHSASATLARLNLMDFWSQAPATSLAGTVVAQPQADGWAGHIALRNAAPGPWDHQRLPLNSVTANVQQQGGRWVVSTLQAQGAEGRLDAQGQWTPPGTGAAPWAGQVHFSKLNPAAWHSRLAATPLSGTLSAQERADPAGAATVFDLSVQPTSGTGRVAGLALGPAHVAGVWRGDTVQLSDVNVQAVQASLQAKGTVKLAAQASKTPPQFEGLATLRFPGGEGTFKGQLNQGDAHLALSQADTAWAWVRSLPGMDKHIPDMQGVRGTADMALQWAGRGAQGLAADVTLQLNGVAEQAPYQAALNSKAVAHFTGLPTLAALAWAPGALDISRWQLQLDDTSRRLSASVQAESPLQLRWADGRIEALPGQLRVRPLAFGTGTATIPQVDPITLAWEQLRWDTDGLRTQGTLTQLSLAWVDWWAGASTPLLADWGLSGQMSLDGDWDVLWPRDSRGPLRLNAGLQRQRGDLRLAVDDGGKTQQVAAGLREASLRISTAPQPATQALPIKLKLQWKSEQAGEVDAEITTQLEGGVWPANAPLRGQLSAQLPQIGAWSLLAPPGWRMKGTLATQATLSGTRAAPQWAGQVQADQLALRSVVDGIEFVNGQLRAKLQGETVVIERFALEGAGGAKAGGSLEAKGTAQWAMETPAAATTSATASTPTKPRRVPHIELQVQLDKLRVSSRADRRLVVSGQAQAQLAGAQLLLRGKLRADQAAITLPDELSPRLGDDVVVRGRAHSAYAGTTTTAASGQVIPDVLLDLDLGENFAVEGSGLKARLQGTLQVRSTASQPAPRLLGEVRTTSGSYRAYGVNLNLETGLLRFAGPLDNPSLDILAIRPNISQRAGVQVSGTALAPIVRLYAEPELPDSEKLSWVVLGRSAAGPGGEAAILQQAALSLLGRPGNKMSGGLAGALGLDEVNYSNGGLNADGTVSAAALSVGKRLSSKLYVVYGQSLTSSVGTVSILYELSRRLTLRAKAGEDNALELVFTQRYD